MRYLILIAALLMPNFASAEKTSDFYKTKNIIDVITESNHPDGEIAVYYLKGVADAYQEFAINDEIYDHKAWCLPPGLEISGFRILSLVEKDPIVAVLEDMPLSTAAFIAIRREWPCK